MMPRNRALYTGTSVLLLLVVGSRDAAAADTPESVLQARGLKRMGLTYVLDGEAEFLKKLARIQPQYDEVKNRFANLAAIVENQTVYDEMDARYKLLTEQLRDVQADIDAHPPLNNNLLRQNWYDLLESEKQLRYQRNALDRELDLRWETLVPESKRERLLAEFQSKRRDFLQDSRDLLEQADKMNENYGQLAKDDAVKKALEAIRTETKSRVALGPSPEFKRKSALLKNAEKAYSPASVTGKKKPRNSKGTKRDSARDSTKRPRS
jgi:hypothetical protein